MKRPVRRVIFFLILTVFIVCICKWALHVPYNPIAVLRGIPSNAVFVSVHDNLSGRWSDLSGSPLMHTAASSMELDPEDIELPSTDEETQLWLDRLAGKRLAFAYAPRLGYTATGGWIACAWAGGYSQRLRWYAELGWVDGIEKIGSHSKRAIWKITDAELPPGYSVTACMAEGVLLVCMSRDPEGIRHVIDTFDGFGAVEPFSDFAKDRKMNYLWEGEEPDRGWINNGKGFTFKLSQHGVEGIVGSVHVPYKSDASNGMAMNTEKQIALGKLLGDVPEGIAISTGAHVRDLLDFADMMIPGGQKWVHIGERLLDKSAEAAGGNPPAFVALFGGEYRGRVKSLYPEELKGMMKGIPVPVAITGIMVGSDTAAADLADRLIDWINASYRLGLITRPLPIGDYIVRAIEGTGDSPYSDLEQSEWAGLAVCDGWLLISSNTDVLKKLVARYQRSEAQAGIDRGRWLNLLKQQTSDESMAYVWSDLSRIGVTIKDTLALVRLGSTGPRKYKQREQLDLAMDWMESIRMLDACTVNVVPQGDGVDVRFCIGNAAK